jgi:hypothetical protein
MDKYLIHYKERSIKDLTPSQRFDPFMTPSLNIQNPTPKYGVKKCGTCNL